VLLVLSPVKALVFVSVHQRLLGLYLGAVFAPTHKGMPILSKDDDSDFLRRQVLTARNVRGGLLTDLLLGGLNYQIEHHLFPHMPCPSLPRAQPVLRTYCLGHGLPYAETSLIDSYRQALAHLDTWVAATSRVDRWRRPTAAHRTSGTPHRPVICDHQARKSAQALDVPHRRRPGWAAPRPSLAAV
jgi:fatty acid desaturase